MKSTYSLNPVIVLMSTLLLSILVSCGGGSGGSSSDSGEGSSSSSGVDSSSSSSGVDSSGSGGSVGTEFADSASTPPPCDLTINPGDSFISAFSQLGSGETLCLSDGVYQQVMEIPGNTNVRAVNDGMAEIDGSDVLGGNKALLSMRGDNSFVRGLKVYHAAELANACSIGGNNNIMIAMSCSHGGSFKHKIPLGIGGSGHLIADSWFYGEGRYVVQCFLGDNITLRRNVVRWDETIAGEPNEPNAAMSNYSCKDMIWENNISLDYGIPATAMIHCGDFCMSTINDVEAEFSAFNGQKNTNVQYLGNIVFNHDPATSNNVAFRADQKGSIPSGNITIKDFFARSVGSAFVFKPIYQNVNIESCTTVDVISDGNDGSQAVSCADDALPIRYVDGVATSDPLAPWPNELLIKRDMCDAAERQSDWCQTNLTLTEYIIDGL